MSGIIEATGQDFIITDAPTLDDVAKKLKASGIKWLGCEARELGNGAWSVRLPAGYEVQIKPHQVWILDDYDQTFGVYSTKELAEEAALRFGCEFGPGEPEAIDQMPDLPDLPDGKYSWLVFLEKDGSLRSVQTVHVEWEWKEQAIRDTHDGNWKCHCYRVQCKAESQEVAIALAKEAIKGVER